MSLHTKEQKFDYPFDVDIDSGTIGGPSAGLAFTLGMIDTLSAGELTGGKKVAATGTIEIDGYGGRRGRRGAEDGGGAGGRRPGVLRARRQQYGPCPGVAFVRWYSYRPPGICFPDVKSLGTGSSPVRARLPVRSFELVILLCHHKVTPRQQQYYDCVNTRGIALPPWVLAPEGASSRR